MTPTTAELLKDIDNAPNHIRLLHKFVTDTSEEIRERFKFMYNSYMTACAAAKSTLQRKGQARLSIGIKLCPLFICLIASCVLGQVQLYQPERARYGFNCTEGMNKMTRECPCASSPFRRARPPPNPYYFSSAWTLYASAASRPRALASLYLRSKDTVAPATSS